jgi:hypothetical protein
MDASELDVYIEYHWPLLGLAPQPSNSLASLENIMDIVIEQIADLAKQLLFAKTDENNARNRRIAIEESIASRIPGPERGQKSVKLPNGTTVTVERGFNYKADLPGIATVFSEKYPDQPQPTKCKTTHELDVIGYEWYRENNKEIFDSISGLVTATPKKISVTVK